MKNFKLFVNEIVNKWRSEKKTLFESAGLSGSSNRENGDLAEDYVLRKVEKLKPNYNGMKSTGSQTPSDIFAVARRNGYFHIMLIQVKSSTNKSGIYKLNENDKKAFDELAKFVKKQIGISEHMKNYRKSSFIISTGYAGVYRNEKPMKHNLIESKKIKIFKRNTSNLDMEKIKEIIVLAHKL